MYQIIDNYIDQILLKSTPEKPLWNQEIIRGTKKPFWNYIDGCMMSSLIQLYNITGQEKYIDYVDNFIDYYVDSQGDILGYKIEDYNLDNINEGRALFYLVKHTNKVKYALAIDNLHQQIVNQPRTSQGNFWHKRIYPNQVWLDGLYMAQPFCVLYEKSHNGSFDDIIAQFLNVHKHMFNKDKGLYHHAYDCTKAAFWVNENGLSKSFWLRAMGWYLVALVDCIEYMGEQSKSLEPILVEAVNGIIKYLSPSGMFYQVVDCAEKEGNYLETSGSAMVSYTLLKGARLGVLQPEYHDKGKRIFDSICKQKLKDNNGNLQLDGICLSAGLGPDSNRKRDGSYAYYISEPVVSNDAKGVAPFLMAYVELLHSNS